MLECRKTPLCAALLALSAAHGAEPTMSAQDVMAERVRPCTACHGKDGRATADGYYPRIAGKPAGYLLNEMNNFRAGRRGYPQMVYFMQQRDDTDLAEIAAYFAAQRLPYPPPAPPRTDPQALERGRKLVHDGNAALHVPACRSCHGSRLWVSSPWYPLCWDCQQTTCRHSSGHGAMALARQSRLTAWPRSRAT